MLVEIVLYLIFFITPAGKIMDVQSRVFSSYDECLVSREQTLNRVPHQHMLNKEVVRIDVEPCITIKFSYSLKHGADEKGRGSWLR